MMARVIAAVLVAVPLLVLGVAAPAHAAGDTPTPTPAGTPTPPPVVTVEAHVDAHVTADMDYTKLSDALANPLKGAVVAGIGSGLDAWLQGSGQEVLLRVLGWLAGEAIKAVRAWVTPLLGAQAGSNLLVTLPADLTTSAPWVVDSWRLFRTVALTALGGGFLVALIVAGLRGLAWGVTWEEVTGAAPAVLVAWLAIVNSLALATWLREGVNALALAFVDATAHLPGWEQLSDAQQTSGDGWASIALLVLAVFVALGRFITLETFNLCVVLSPLGILFALVPGTSFIPRWIGAKLLQSALVQVPQAIAIGQGAALLGAFGAGAGALSFGLGVGCYWLAARLPAMLRMGVGGGAGLLRNGASVARFAALGFASPATAGAATVREVTGMAGAAARASTPLIEASYRLAPLQPAPLRALPH